MLRLRSVLALAVLAFAGSAHAVLLQVWTKSLITGGKAEVVSGVSLDSAGNTYAASYYRPTAGTSSAVLRKFGPTGTILWTRPLNDAGAVEVESRDLVLDAGGNIYVAIYDAPTLLVKLKKVRGSDGAILGTLAPPDSVQSSSSNLDVTIDGAGQVFLTLKSREDGTDPGALCVFNINPSSIALSTVRRVNLPPDAVLIHCRKRPGGGVMVMAGQSVRQSPEPFYYVSSLYSFGPSGSPKIIPLGYAGASAIDPISGEAVYVGGSRSGSVYRQRGAPDQIPDTAKNSTVTIYPTSIRDVAVTKRGVICAVGCFHSSETEVDSMAAFYNMADLEAGPRTTVTADGNEQTFHQVAVDNYDGLIATENNSFLILGIHELDVTAAAPVHSRLYSMASLALAGYSQATLSTGLTAVGAGDRLVIVKPRDLKDIYMASTTYKGGASATAIIRMYEPHTISRPVLLSDTSPNASLPASKSVSANQSTTSVVVTTTPVSVTQSVTLTAKYGIQTRTFTFSLTP